MCMRFVGRSPLLTSSNSQSLASVVSCEVLDFADDFSLQGEYERFSACVDGQLLVEVAERSGIIDGGDGEFLSHSDGFGV